MNSNMARGKVLILGSKGMLGSQLMRLYGPRAVGWFKDDENGFDFTNLANFKTAISELNPTAVINCVAYNDVDGAEDEKNKNVAFQINAASVGELAKICQDFEIPLVHFSTNYVFDGEKKEYREDDIPNPFSAYGLSKYEGEKLLQKNCEKFYLIRTAVIFGISGEESGSKKSFAEFVLDRARNREPIYAYTDEVGSVTYAVDLAQNIKLLLDKRYPYGIYHIVNSGSATRYEFAEETLKIRNLLDEAELERVTFEQKPRRAKIPKNAVLINTKLPPIRPWKEALKEFLTSNFSR